MTVGAGKTVKPLAGSFGFVACLIRGAQKSLSVTALGSESNADRDVNADRPPFNAVRYADLRDETLGQPNGSLPLRNRHLQHRELVPS